MLEEFSQHSNNPRSWICDPHNGEMPFTRSVDDAEPAGDTLAESELNPQLIRRANRKPIGDIRCRTSGASSWKLQRSPAGAKLATTAQATA
jgi:hypothetical protein